MRAHLSLLKWRVLEPRITSLARSAASAVATALPGSISGTDKLLPTNCSLGITQYYVDCNRLPLHLSSALALSVTLMSVADSQIRELDSLQPILHKVSPAYMEGFLTLGFCLVILMALVIPFRPKAEHNNRNVSCER